MNRFGTDQSPRNIAVVGTGISGMAAAWLLSQHHRVTVYEKDDRIGGHTNTVTLDGPSRSGQCGYGVHRLQRP